MPATYEPIASTTISGSTADVTFSSIAGTWTDLRVVCHVTASPDNDLNVTINSDTGSNYSRTVIYGNGSTVASERSSNASKLVADGLMFIDDSEYSIYVLDFMSYSNANVYKTVLVSATRAGRGVEKVVGLWRSTSAITSIKLFADSGNFTNGVISLYGIKAA